MKFSKVMLSTAVAVLVAGSTAWAVPTPILIDPGPVGATPGALRIPITIEAENVENNSIDLLFDDMKHVELGAGRYNVGFFQTDVTNFDYTYFFSDENGNPIPGTTADGTLNNNSFTDGITLAEPIIIHDVHFTFQDPLPATPLNWEFVVANIGGSILVGEWTAAVPEPATALMGLMGVGGLALRFKRRVV